MMTSSNRKIRTCEIEPKFSNFRSPNFKVLKNYLNFSKSQFSENSSEFSRVPKLTANLKLESPENQPEFSTSESPNRPKFFQVRESFKILTRNYSNFESENSTKFSEFPLPCNIDQKYSIL